MKDEKVNEQTQCDPAPFRQGLALDSEGNIMVVDNGNHRLQTFGPDGIFIASFGERGPPTDVS